MNFTKGPDIDKPWMGKMNVIPRRPLIFLHESHVEIVSLGLFEERHLDASFKSDTWTASREYKQGLLNRFIVTVVH